MKFRRRTAIIATLSFLSFGGVWACSFDGSLREYLHASFWLPLAKRALDFEQRGVRRINAPFAGMVRDQSQTPLARLRTIYLNYATPGVAPTDTELAEVQRALAALRVDASVAQRDREEADLLDAKFDVRSGSSSAPEPLQRAKQKLRDFLKKAQTPSLVSEARGWLAHVHYQLGEQSAAGKLYFDELNRSNSNLSEETLLNSLKITYRYDGGPRLMEQLEDYFDTPEHEAFAIQLATNPRWSGSEVEVNRWSNEPLEPAAPIPYERLRDLLQKHRNLFRSEKGANTLTLLALRITLRAADPRGALRIVSELPSDAAIRTDPDFLWMLASSHFLSHDFASAEAPLLALFQSTRATKSQKAAAAYGLCGVYQKLHNRVEQLRFALWLRSNSRDAESAGYARIDDLSVYWALSGWDLNLLLEIEAPVEALRTFISKYPKAQNLRSVQYSLAVRLAREKQYEESAQLYTQLNVLHRAARMHQLNKLYRKTEGGGATPQAKFELATYIAANQERLFFNDALWGMIQRYALRAAAEGRFSAEERNLALQQERELKDAQEEYWQAYLILRDVVQQAGNTPLGRRAAELAITCLLKIRVDRFGREQDLVKNRRELVNWLRKRG